MSTYNENVQETKQETLSNLYQNQQKLNSERKSAEYALYFAQSAQINATDKLRHNEMAYDYMENVQQQCVLSESAVDNLLVTTTASDTATQKAITDMAVAANNTQLAANAILQLASDIGGAFNTVSSADFGSAMYELTDKTNQFIRRTAYNAELASTLAMEATTDVSEIIAKKVLTESTTAKTELAAMMTATDTQLQGLATAKTADVTALSLAKKAEKASEGKVIDAEQAYFATVTSYQEANTALNLGLTVSVEPGSTKSIKVTFAHYQVPFPLTKGDWASSPKKGDTLKSDGLDVPHPKPVYYLVVVPEDKKGLFGLRTAEALFASNPKRFIPIKTTSQNPQQPISSHDGSSTRGGHVPPDGVHVIHSSRSSDGASGSSSSPISINRSLDTYKDAEGKDIKQGVGYVAYVYVELHPEFKKYVGNFDDVLTAPSLPFTFTTLLPVPTSINTKPDGSGRVGNNQSEPVRSFTLTMTEDVPLHCELRFMLLPKGALGFGEHVTTDYHLPPFKGTGGEKKKMNPNVEGDPGFYFNLAIALQVSPANYTLAVQNRDHMKSFEVTIDSDTTDNFGNPLINGEAYYPVVLSVMPEDALDSKNYSSNISSLSPTPIQIVPLPEVALSTVEVGPVRTVSYYINSHDRQCEIEKLKNDFKKHEDVIQENNKDKTKLQNQIAEDKKGIAEYKKQKTQLLKKIKTIPDLPAQPDPLPGPNQIEEQLQKLQAEKNALEVKLKNENDPAKELPLAEKIEVNLKEQIALDKLIVILRELSEIKVKLGDAIQNCELKEYEIKAMAQKLATHNKHLIELRISQLNCQVHVLEQQRTALLVEQAETQKEMQSIQHSIESLQKEIGGTTNVEKALKLREELDLAMSKKFKISSNIEHWELQMLKLEEKVSALKKEGGKFALPKNSKKKPGVSARNSAENAQDSSSVDPDEVNSDEDNNAEDDSQSE